MILTWIIPFFIMLSIPLSISYGSKEKEGNFDISIFLVTSISLITFSISIDFLPEYFIILPVLLIAIMYFRSDH